jgi:hypothetical protein
MSEQKRGLLLILIMAGVSLIVEGVTMLLRYQVVFQQEQMRLAETRG